MQSFCIKRVSVLSRLNLEKMQGLFFPQGQKKVHNNEVSFKQMSMKWDLTVLIFRRSLLGVSIHLPARGILTPQRKTSMDLSA